MERYILPTCHKGKEALGRGLRGGSGEDGDRLFFYQKQTEQADGEQNEGENKDGQRGRRFLHKRVPFRMKKFLVGYTVRQISFGFRSIIVGTESERQSGQR